LEKCEGQPNVVGRITVYGVVLARLYSSFASYAKKKNVFQNVSEPLKKVSWQKIIILYGICLE